jgi:hypothetical protein
MKVSGQLHAPTASPPGELAASTHGIRAWVGARAGLGTVEKLKTSYLCMESNLGRPALSLVAVPA